MRKLNLSKQSVKFLDKLIPKHFFQIDNKLEKLKENPLPEDSVKLKGGVEKNFRVDVGEYRIIYRWDETILYIELIGKRNDGEVYKKFDRSH